MRDIHPLRSRTDPDWVGCVLDDFDSFLVDHALCERKAAATALGFAGKFASFPAIVEPMVTLAREELAHYLDVFRLLTKRGVAIKEDHKDPYAKGLIGACRDDHWRLLDRLVVAGIIEARGQERLSLVARELEDQDLRIFYTRLAKEEAGHFRVFINAAKAYFAPEEVTKAVERIALAEAKILEGIPLRAVVH